MSAETRALQVWLSARGPFLSNREKRAAVARVLADPVLKVERRRREIARHVGCSHTFVNKVARELPEWLETASSDGAVVELSSHSRSARFPESDRDNLKELMVLEGLRELRAAESPEAVASMVRRMKRGSK